MNVEFEYIHGANLALHITAEVRFGRPAKIDALPEDCYEAEDSEVEIERVTFLSHTSANFETRLIELDFEIDDISVAGQSLEQILKDAAMESLA